MKEVKKWSGEARYMWVWDDNVNNKEKRKVVYIFNGIPTFPVFTVGQFDDVEFFKHCAEIEKSRRMTKQELSWWLRDGKHREWSYKGLSAHPYFDYNISDADEPVDDDILVRENGGEFVEPLISLLLD